MKSVAIIGTRKPSEKMSNRITQVAAFLVKRGIHVRTGGAVGIDEDAMLGAASVDSSKLHIFLPWADYNKELIPAGSNLYLYNEKTCPSWNQSVDKFHPAPVNLSNGARALHARNYGIIMFPEPVDIVIAVPRSIHDEGGTGQGMRIAIGNNVKLYNLLINDEWVELKTLLDLMKGVKK
jgi:hypothetical protein